MFKEMLWMLPQFMLLFKRLLIVIEKGRSWERRDDWSDSEWLYLHSYPSLVMCPQAPASPSSPDSDSAKTCGFSRGEVAQHRSQGVHRYQREAAQQQRALTSRG